MKVENSKKYVLTEKSTNEHLFHFYSTTNSSNLICLEEHNLYIIMRTNIISSLYHKCNKMRNKQNDQYRKNQKKNLPIQEKLIKKKLQLLLAFYNLLKKITLKQEDLLKVTTNNSTGLQ